MAAIKHFGLIGYPLGHSWSQDYFSSKFKKEDIHNCSYSLFPIRTIKELPGLLAQHPNLVGLNVTIPYKEDVIELLDHLSDTAKAVGAVNTIAIERVGNKTRLTGHNTDVYGFEKSLEAHHIIGIPGSDKKEASAESTQYAAMVLGTGGASKAVCWVLERLGWRISLVSRNPEQQHMYPYHVLSYGQITSSDMERHKLIVNTTPLGMSPHVSAYPDIPYHFLTNNHILYDLVYNPEITKFLEFGMQAGVQTIGGLDMLKLQAEKSFEIWTNPEK